MGERSDVFQLFQHFERFAVLLLVVQSRREHEFYLVGLPFCPFENEKLFRIRFHFGKIIL